MSKPSMEELALLKKKRMENDELLQHLIESRQERDRSEEKKLLALNQRMERVEAAVKTVGEKLDKLNVLLDESK